MRRRLCSLKFCAPIAVALLVVFGTLAALAADNGRHRDTTRGQAVRRASAEAVALQRQLDRALNAPIALAAYVQLNDGSIDGFPEFTDRMRALVPSITNLQLAPDGVVSYIHPLAGNEAAIGHDLLADRARSTEAFAAVESGVLTMAGPFDLVQGGTAMVGRQPIYLPGAGTRPGLNPDFWGFATVLIDLEDFFAASRVGELMADGYDYELARYDRDAETFVTFRESGPMVDPVQVEVAVANGTWRLSLGRDGGWGVDGWTAPQIALAVVLGLVAHAALRHFLRRDERLVAAVDQRTRQLREAVAETEQARDEAERASAAKTTFLANVSHELRTPMNAILGFAELIDDAELGATDRDSLGQIRSAGEHLLKLINQVLDITAIESGHLELDLAPVDVTELAQKVTALLDPLAEANGVAMSVDGADTLALGDEHRLFQVLSNLTANAIRFTPAGGRVSITTKHDASQCVIEVSDTGVGISDEHLPTIFDAFDRGGASATVEGTGIGLAIVHRLVGAMGGRIEVESEVDRGTTFRVYVPAVGAERPELVGMS